VPERTQAQTADQSLREQLLREQLDKATAERTAAFLELMDKRAEQLMLREVIADLRRQLADHPTEVAKLTGECEYWADRCGQAEQDRDEQRDRAEFIEAAFAAEEDRGDRMRDEAQHWAERCAELVGEREAAEAALAAARVRHEQWDAETAVELREAQATLARVRKLHGRWARSVPWWRTEAGKELGAALDGTTR